MLLASVILSIVVGVWAGIEKSWQILLLAVAVLLAALAQNPTIHL